MGEDAATLPRCQTRPTPARPLAESQLTTDQAEALRKQMPGCKIALIKRYD